MCYPTEHINLQGLYNDNHNDVFDSLYPLAIPNGMGPKATELYYKAQTVHNIRNVITKVVFKDSVGIIYEKEQLLKGKMENIKR